MNTKETILSILENSEVVLTAQEIAHRLKEPYVATQEELHRLDDLGLVHMKHGFYRWSGVPYKNTTEGDN